ncbi:MAG: hypothetical protein LBI85_03735, partial [Spirochaetaceae bacterium]|nr:hypothetical protein [Spirochaetaceae bacterium]
RCQSPFFTIKIYPEIWCLAPLRGNAQGVEAESPVPAAGGDAPISVWISISIFLKKQPGIKKVPGSVHCTKG